MTAELHSTHADTWLGTGPTAFNDGKLWIGRHSADGDTLVFDPSLSDPVAANLSFFSLSQFRQRTFPRAVVVEMIQEITDQLQRARAKKQYKQWPALKAAHEHDQTAARDEASHRQRERIVWQHRRFLENRGIAHHGVHDISTGKKAGASARRRIRCHACGITLDDFVGSECVVCHGVLCSCGACGCTGTVERG